MFHRSSTGRTVARLRLLMAALLVSIVTTACSSDLVGPEPSSPSYNGSGSGDDDGSSKRGEGGFGSGG